MVAAELAHCRGSVRVVSYRHRAEVTILTISLVLGIPLVGDGVHGTVAVLVPLGRGLGCWRQVVTCICLGFVLEVVLVTACWPLTRLWVF